MHHSHTQQKAPACPPLPNKRTMEKLIIRKIMKKEDYTTKEDEKGKRKKAIRFSLEWKFHQIQEMKLHFASNQGA